MQLWLSASKWNLLAERLVSGSVADRLPRLPGRRATITKLSERFGGTTSAGNGLLSSSQHDILAGLPCDGTFETAD
jgi:hypothetical protein